MPMPEPCEPPAVGREKVCVGKGPVRVVVTVAVSIEGVESGGLETELVAVVVRVVREAVGVGAVAVAVEVRVGAVGGSAGSVVVVSILVCLWWASFWPIGDFSLI